MGENVDINLRLLDIPQCVEIIKGVAMEVQDCAFPNIVNIITTDDPMVAF